MTTAIEALKALVEDDQVAEILVDGPEQVYIERQGRLEDTGIRFSGAQQVIDWANGLLEASGWETVGEGRLWVDGRLQGGERILVVIPPVAVKGPSVVIRKFRSRLLTFDQLIQFGSIDPTIFDFLKVVMQARLNLIVAGGTASGKTTLTSMIVGLVPEDERLVAVERTNELRISHERLVYLEAESAGRDAEVEVGDLLQVASRMRPDRIIVGELMGAEVVEMLRLMNTGHEGMVATIHAKGLRDTLARLETMVTIAEPSLTLPVIRSEIASAVDLIIYCNRLEDGSRKILSIAEVLDLKGDNIVLQEIFVWRKTGISEDGRLSGAFEATGAVPSFVPTLAAMGLTFPEGMFEA